MKWIFHWISILSLLVGGFWYLLPKEHRFKQMNTWQQLVMPGELIEAHAFLDRDCSSCHTATLGVKDSTCISCHANDESLLQRQPTAFHSSIQNCVICHNEHQGRSNASTTMDHELLTKIGLKLLLDDQSKDRDYRQEGKRLAAYLNHFSRIGTDATSSNQQLSVSEHILNCNTCHSNEDPHRTYFGKDCAECHSTKVWIIPSFQHPSPSNRECAQCHSAPPSHYMMHFKMISAKVAGRPHAKMNECFECHETTSWNDIRDVGWYKHH